MMGDRGNKFEQKNAKSGELPAVLVDISKAWGWDATSANLQPLIVMECAINVFRTLQNEIGTNQTIEAIRPHNKIMGLNTASMAKARFGQLGNDAEGIAMPVYWFHYCTSNGHCKPLEIRDGKAIEELYFCAITLFDAPPEACVAMCHLTAGSMCQAINPDYEYVWTHHLTDGDSCCRYIVKKKSSKLDLENLGKLEKTIPLELSSLEMETLSAGVAFGQLNIFTSVSVEAIGSERTIQLLTPLTRKMGLKLGDKLKELAGRNDPVTIKDRLDSLSAMFNQKGDPAIITESGIEKVITDCPCKSGALEVCKQFEGVFNGVCEAINPDYEFAYDRMMSKGDPTCHWVVREKGELAKEKTKEEAVLDNPSRILAIRYAKGEISEEEYEKKMALIKKHYPG